MTTAFISDIHLSAEHPASMQRFEEFLARAVGRLAHLYILGDLFDYWVGDDGSTALGHDRACAAMAQAAAGGVRLYFMRGNRDFLIGAAFAERSGCTLLDDPTIIALGARTVVLTHGDALCTDDVEHQQARREMLSAKWQNAFLDQPLEQRMHAAAAMRSQSEASKRTKSPAVMDVTQAAVEALMRHHGADTMIHGHTHRPAVHPFTMGDRPAWRYVLGDWYHQRSVLYYQDDTLVLRR